MMEGEAPIKVLFLGGHGRSGSTLLDRLLGQLPGFFSAGEVRNIWYRGALQNQLCECGSPFHSCPFWGSLAPTVLGQLNGESITELQHAVDRGRYIPWLLSPVQSARRASNTQQYVKVLGHLFREIQRRTGCRVIVDASKDPSHGFLLAQVEGIELYTLQLVRDSRAVSFSWMRKKARPEVHWKEEFMQTCPPARTGWQWLVRNLLVHVLGRYSRSYMMLRYEDFVRTPKQALERIAAFVGERIESVPFIDGTAARVPAGHGMAGNPVRFDRGTLAIRPDTEWAAKMHPRHRYTVTALTFPLLVYYRYVQPRFAR
jgi:hypothetical protein